MRVPICAGHRLITTTTRSPYDVNQEMGWLWPMFLGGYALFGMACGSSNDSSGPLDGGAQQHHTETGAAPGTGDDAGGRAAQASALAPSRSARGNHNWHGRRWRLGRRFRRQARRTRAQGRYGLRRWWFPCLKSTDNLSATSPGGVGNGICTLDCTASAAACGPSGGAGALASTRTPPARWSRVRSASSRAPSDRILRPRPASSATAAARRRVRAGQPGRNALRLHPHLRDRRRLPRPQVRAVVRSLRRHADAGQDGRRGCTVTRGMSNNECAGGLCLPIEAIPDGGTTTPGVCTALCRLGTPKPDQYRISPIDAGPPMGACVLPWGDTGYNTGDLGLCLQLCDARTTAATRLSNWTCRTDITLQWLRPLRLPGADSRLIASLTGCAPKDAARAITCEPSVSEGRSALLTQPPGRIASPLP